MQDKLVSVIVPTYNNAHLIEETLQSIRRQTHTNLEVLVVDDGSTDDTRDVVQRFVAHDPRFNYFHIQNSGGPTARNIGFQKARGDFVAVVDADDLWPEDKLAHQLETLEGREDSISVGNVQRFSVDEHGRKTYGAISEVPGDQTRYVESLLSLDITQMVNFNTMLAPRHIIVNEGLWDPNIVTAHDWENWIRLAKRYPFVHTRKILQFYRKHNRSSTVANSARKALHYQLQVVDRHTPPGLRNHWKRRAYRAKRYRQIIQALKHENRYGEGVKLWVEASLRSNLPFKLRGLRLLASLVARRLLQRGA